MNFHDFAVALQSLENTASRNEMTKQLADLFKKARQDDIGKIAYLLQGRVTPLYDATEFGIAQKLMVRAIAKGVSIKESEVRKVFKKTGDLGKTVEKLKVKPACACLRSQAGRSEKLKVKEKSIVEIYDQLVKVAHASGAGSQDVKIKLLADVIKGADSLSARYIVRIPLNKLRLGFSDMTVLDALSWMLTGDKSKRKDIECAYHVRPDLAYIAESVKKSGIKEFSHVVPVPGTPILMARANRLSQASDILKKIGKCAIEYKYDGLRLQVHKNGKEIHMFSRNLEEVTQMFPDIKKAVLKQIKAESVIFEGEVVAYNPQTGVFVPFQQTMQRKRKYDIDKYAAEIPVKLFAFELLFANGKSFLGKSYEIRKKKLKQIVSNGKTIVYAKETITDNDAVIEGLFEDSVAKHFEGIIAKRLDGLYEAGIRGWNWIKFKKAMSKKLSDTIDVLVMGFTRGQGKRTAFGVGQFLTGVYDKKKDRFVTITKIGTGLTDAQFREFSARVKKLTVSQRPKNYNVDKLLEPDVWLTPSLVVEVGCDEITRSAVHTAGRVMQPSKSGKALTVKESGYALRFPRLVKFRDDKRSIDATTLEEVKSMYKRQKS